MVDLLAIAHPPAGPRIRHVLKHALLLLLGPGDLVSNNEWIGRAVALACSATEAAFGRWMSTATVTLRFGVNGSIRGRVAGSNRNSTPPNSPTRDNRIYRA
jgi:hypothetical protein